MRTRPDEAFSAVPTSSHKVRPNEGREIACNVRKAGDMAGGPCGRLTWVSRETGSQSRFVAPPNVMQYAENMEKTSPIDPPIEGDLRPVSTPTNYALSGHGSSSWMEKLTCKHMDRAVTRHLHLNAHRIRPEPPWGTTSIPIGYDLNAHRVRPYRPGSRAGRGS